MNEKLKSIFVFDNGNLAFFGEDGEQIVSLQEHSLVDVLKEWLKTEGYNAEDAEFLIQGAERPIKIN